MKNAKKVLAMVIVLALAISMAIPVSAAVDVTINQSDSSAQAGAVYTYWKIADLSYAEGGAYRYTVTEDWKDFVEAHDGVVEEGEPDEVQFFNYNSDTGVITEFSTDGIAISSAAKAWANDKKITGTKTDSAVNKKVTIEDLEDGYYLLASSLGTELMLDTVLNSTDGNKDIEIDEKNKIPTINKTVRNVTDGETTADKATDAAYGEIVEYTINVTAGAGAVNYVVTDTLPTGLTYVSASPEPTSQTGNSLSFNLGTSGGTITIQAKVTSAASVDTAITNTATLTYGVESDFSTSSSADVYVWSFDINKIKASDKTDLTGAKFSLYSDEACNNIISFVKIEDGKYRLATSEDQAANQVTELEDKDAKYIIEGLDSGVYYLKETKAPDGYNLIVGATKIEIVGTESNNGYAKTINVTDELIDGETVKIENSTGAILPETGGVGTVIFVVVGSFLVMAMGVLLVVRKRMSKVVYTR